jgi:ABC-type multidrug transport system fused ATPase/permease subunit
MDDGRIIEQGIHEELVNRENGLYRKLCQNQLVE